VASQKFVDQLNAQVGHEFTAHQQYVACAVYYDAATMPQLAAFFYRQALEERDHAMMMVRYLLDADADVRIPGADAPTSDFDDIVGPIELALGQERRVAGQIHDLTALARSENDYASDQFMQWFIKEQVEEIATMSSLLTVARRSRDDIEAIEEYVAREHGSAVNDPMAPPAAGATTV
jgi:ferritin